ncbi:hypothetical protein AVEN_233570-1 [Araneus ventricosus]|uniref:Uncharacterized protein n=1 Tax=Araneus ventricosus TaxID=182803 RepID=A0A4Y2HPQ7_ARAVE|nr:hypothetical protein AVEN_233570-1 [Araneus ventricosus]
MIAEEIGFLLRGRFSMPALFSRSVANRIAGCCLGDGLSCLLEPISDASTLRLPQGKNDVLKRWPRFGENNNNVARCHIFFCYKNVSIVHTSISDYVGER